MRAIKYQRVGASGVEISRVGLGGYELGPEPDEDPDVARAARVIATAIDCGVNWIDTSENYLATRNEAVIGAALDGIPDGGRAQPDRLSRRSAVHREMCGARNRRDDLRTGRERSPHRQDDGAGAGDLGRAVA